MAALSSAEWAAKLQHGIEPRDIGASSWADTRAIALWQSARGLAADGVFGPKSAAHYKALHEPPAVTHRASAWAGHRTITEPAKWVPRALQLGLSDLCLVCNDGSAGADFELRKGIAACAKAAKDAGLGVSLMTWLKAVPSEIAKAGPAMVALAAEVGAHAVQLDLEEQWIKTAKTCPDAAHLVAHAFTGVPRLGVNGIVFTDLHALGPVLTIADFGVPQAYSTKNAYEKWKARPGMLQKTAHAKWSPRVRCVEMGLAGYDLAGANGLTERAAMAACLQACDGLGVTSVHVWQLEGMTQAMGDAIKAWRGV